MYRTLVPEKIIDTLEVLGRRISERFPGSGLAHVSDDLIVLARQTTERIAYVSRPHWGLRFTLALVVASTLAILATLLLLASNLKGSDQLSDAMQGVDAAVNLTIVLGGAAFFASTFETRWKRTRALQALHELRAIVHVIDMHQLTKDPSSDRRAVVSTELAGKRSERLLTAFEMTRYLDYCSEMLSLTAKCAALYAEQLSDAVVVDTVGDIERLTSDLSSKIWQKITIVQSLEGSRDIPPPAFAPHPQSGTP